MINVKEAVEIALRFADEVLGRDKLMDPRLEEVEFSANGQEWLVTLSFIREPSKLGEMLEPMAREYKVLAVGSESGEVQSMKIRQPV